MVTIHAESCIGCMACAVVCPEGALDLIGDYLAALVAPDQCTGCGTCEDECPQDAIRVKVQ